MLHSSHLHPRVQTGEVAGRLPCVLSASPRPAGKLCRHGRQAHSLGAAAQTVSLSC